MLSSVRVYGEQRDLPFFLYEKQLAQKFFAAHVRAKRMGVTGDVMARDSQSSAGYWEIVQDALADLVRIMMVRCYDEENFPQLYRHVRDLRGQVWLSAFPNLFITIAPAEWKFPRPYFLQSYLDCIFASAYIMALHMYYLVRCVLMFLFNRHGHRFFVVYEWVVKTEYQGRGTPHWHIACWIVCFYVMKLLQGRTGTAIVSVFVKFLGMLFSCEIDVQVGNGRLNYINGYVAKDHDAADVGLGEYVQKDSTASWLAAYRLLSKSSPCIPEVAIRMAQLTEFDRSYSHVLLYPPQPVAMLEYEGRQVNFTSKMYGIFIEEQRLALEASKPISESFLVWHRDREYDSNKQTCVFRGGKHQQTNAPTRVVACRFWYELTDGFWGQYMITQIPHSHPRDILPREFKHLDSMQNFVGMLEYLVSWRWERPGVVKATGGAVFDVKALPFLIEDSGEVKQLRTYVEGGAVFSSDEEAFEYIVALAKRDLQYRGMRDDRMRCFHYKQEANFLLYKRVRASKDAIEYEMLRQCWDTINRPKQKYLKWSPKQEEALEKIREGISYDDEDAKAKSWRWLYIPGAPGSGKSALMFEAALRAAMSGMRVLIVCPTGQLAHQFKAQLPEVDGIENIQIDTIHGVLKYKRPGKDQQVRWAPPSALRRMDLILVDEGSQYDDTEWERFFQCIKEQPHSPFTVVVADFQQLQPVVSGGSCRYFCEKMPKVELDTVYRSTDEAHLVFLNRVRYSQPSKETLRDYFGDRHWRNYSLEACVAYSMEIAQETGKPFTWLTATNRGSSEVCAAALSHLRVSEEELANGFKCDPAAKSNLRIVAQKGILVRLTRNFDKQRGFVNGALAEVWESLSGNAVFVARLFGTGNMVLVHPMEEDGSIFLPCCYGYATTIRRAQGASLDQGCLYFDQKKFHAGRGYGYVGTSRFKNRAGVHVFGRLRRTDFLPVGEEKEADVLERGIDSESSDGSDDEEGDHGLQYAFGARSDDESEAGVLEDQFIACDF